MTRLDDAFTLSSPLIPLVIAVRRPRPSCLQWPRPPLRQSQRPCWRPQTPLLKVLSKRRREVRAKCNMKTKYGIHTSKKFNWIELEYFPKGVTRTYICYLFIFCLFNEINICVYFAGMDLSFCSLRDGMVTPYWLILLFQCVFYSSQTYFMSV